MPSASGPRMYETHIPSFMSVYGMDSVLPESPDLVNPPELAGKAHNTEHLPSLNEGQDEDRNRDGPAQIHAHQHRESNSTQNSDSTDSSPTTTISTVDSVSLSDPSPSSSPESPITLVPLSSFSGSTFGLDSFQHLKMIDGNPPRLPLINERPMTSPSPRKSKNPKSLALNLRPNMDSFQSSEPASPSFIKPPPLKARRKPSLLSLNTGAANSLLSAEPVGTPGISTMLQRRGLKHSISSPQMLLTPAFGPSGGMTFGERKAVGPSRFKESSLANDTFTIDEDVHEVPSGVQMATRIPGVAVGGDTFDRPHSGEDAQSPCYPEGPILMHEPSVHLYAEPKKEEAMEFDVVINVAKEVKNPFEANEEEKGSKNASHSSGTESISFSPEMHDSVPNTAATMMSFRTAFEVQPSGSTESSPTTPKPNVEKKVPEYIHVPWDHNTDVKDELWDLCQTIEARTKAGKKVLVHCQQGASRSATLIIAYHMYINQDLGPNEAYQVAQSKSRWVNPNMSLLFSLNDFKKVIEQKKAEKNLKNNIVVRKPASKHRPTLSADAIESPSNPSRARGNSTPNASARGNTFGQGNGQPLEAATGISVRSDIIPNPEERIEPATQSAISRLGGFDFGFENLPVRNEPPKRDVDEWEDLMSPRITSMTDNPIHHFASSLGPSNDANDEIPPTPGLFSPRTFEFPRSSFFPPPLPIALAAEEDPRSPPTKGEAPIIRSIDDVL